jgi:hypothetical protein
MMKHHRLSRRPDAKLLVAVGFWQNNAVLEALAVAIWQQTMALVTARKLRTSKVPAPLDRWAERHFQAAGWLPKKVVLVLHVEPALVIAQSKKKTWVPVHRIAGLGLA